MIFLYIGIGVVILFVILVVFSACKVAGEADSHIETEVKECPKKIQQ